METKSEIRNLSANIENLKNSIKRKKESIEEKENKLAELISEYNDYVKEVFKSKKIRSVSFKRFKHLLCHFSKEKDDYVTDFDKDDILTFFGEDKYGRITELFNIEISTMLKGNGYCNINYKKFNLFSITSRLEHCCVSIYYTKNTNEYIRKIDFSK
nr:MAG TPA: hypothetical protein [Caudoviricetes sp.]